jgi:hypothetical protein
VKAYHRYLVAITADDPHLQFVAYDLNVGAYDLPAALKTIGAVGGTDFFHLAYIHHDSFERQYNYNVRFFNNVLTAVDQLNRDSLQRVVLQTGENHYGFHYKPPQIIPTTEDRKWMWTVTRPFLISGLLRVSSLSHRRL